MSEAVGRPDPTAAAGVATALLAGAWTADAMTGRLRDAVGLRRRTAGLRALVDDVLAAYRDAPRDRPRELAGYVATLRSFRTLTARGRPARVVAWTPVPTATVRSPWPVTPLDDLGALARLLDLDQGELAWFADVRGLERDCARPLRHYRWVAVPKRDGFRLLAAPKPRLKEIQRRLLRHVLAPIPPHPAARGSVPGHSVRTALQPHAHATVVIRADLEAFYPSVTAARVWGVLRTAGLPEAVAHCVTGLVTTVVPREVWAALPVPDAAGPGAHRRLGTRLAEPHLPQGAPSSPALANLVAYHLDRRLAGLAGRFGALYTRYVDDLVFSGGPSLRSTRARFVELLDAIVRDEGLRLNDRKTVVLGDAGRQQALGAVVNVRPTVPRPERDRLRAILHNCAVHGWRSQVRAPMTDDAFRAHVHGRVAWAAGLDPVFGARVRAQLAAIDWS